MQNQAPRDFKAELNVLGTDFERIRQDFASTLASWAIWEAGNGYPHYSRRNKLAQALRDQAGVQAANTVRNNALGATVIGLGRMLDSIPTARDSSRISIFRLLAVLDDTEFEPYLHVDVNSNGISSRTWIHASEIYEFHHILQTRLRENQKGLRNTFEIREKLKALRDGWIAHSLRDASPSQVTRTLIRHAIVLLGYLISVAQLLLFGLNWDAKGLWRKSVREAQAFWDKLEFAYSYSI